MNARRQAPTGSPPDVGQSPATHAGSVRLADEPPGQPTPAGASGNGEPAKTPLPTRVPASRPGGSGREIPGRQPAGRSSFGHAASWLAGRRGEAAQQAEVLSSRLMALSRMIQIGSARSGREGFSKKLLGQAEDVLGRAGERMRLSSAHTVVVLAGGTGSGKSALFNSLAGADFSTVGVTRPITREAHACIWDETGAGALLEWLGIPQRNRYSRASALGGGESGLAGLVLLDLPDHDSVLGHAAGQVDRLVSLADVMIWVLDPQKYADASVHNRFLIPLAGHADVQAIVLNQADLLTAGQIDDCVADLRRLLDSEDLHDVPILATSAVTGTGLGDLRQLLADGVAAGRAAVARISDDVDTVVARFRHHAGVLDGQAEQGGPRPADSTGDLADKFGEAAGVTAVGDALRSARELRAADFVGWPIAWLTQRLTGRDPLRKVRLSMLWNDLRSVTAGPAGAQQAAIDNALNEFGDRLAASLPKPWAHTVKAAARSRADAIPAALGEAIGAALPAEDSIEGWWRLAGLGQGVLLGAVAVALAWLIAAVVFGVFHAVKGLPGLLTHPSSAAWALLAVGVGLGAGAVIASWCMSLVRKRALAENARIAADIRTRIEAVATEMAVMPAEQELSELQRYRDEFMVALTGAAAEP